MNALTSNPGENIIIIIIILTTIIIMVGNNIISCHRDIILLWAGREFIYIYILPFDVFAELENVWRLKGRN